MANALDSEWNSWTDPKYDIVHFILALLYVLLCFATVAIVARLIAKGHWHLHWQKFFHPMLMAGSLVRAIFFVLQPFLMEGYIKIPNKLNVFLNIVPSFLFFSDYLVILFLWAEIYHYAHTDSSHVGIAKLRPIFIALTVLMYGAVCILFGLDYLLYPTQTYIPVAMAENPVQQSIYFLALAVYVSTSVGFLIYGIALRVKFSSIPVNTNSKKKILVRIQVLTILVTICFVLRCGIIVMGIMWNLSKYWWFDGIYFFTLELVPLVLMMKLLHSDSARRGRNGDPERENLIRSAASISINTGTKALRNPISS